VTWLEHGAEGEKTHEMGGRELRSDVARAWRGGGGGRRTRSEDER
jgi:hypothetical protein